MSHSPALLVLGGKPESTPGIAMVAGPTHTGKLPTIVVSHGAAGSAEGHMATAVALATAGFIVVAVDHTADNYRDIAAVGKDT